MPFLDPSDVLLDPDFCDPALSCVRSASSTSALGIGELSQTTIGFAGVVTIDRGLNLARLAAGEHAEGSISIITRFLLQAQAPGFTADVVSWNNSQYTVVRVNPYPRYGIGFYEAICDLLPLSG